jgi:hypothetical protein
MVEITLPIILQFVQTVGVLVGIFYYLTIMRNQQRTRELSLKAQEAAEKARQREMILQRSQIYSLDYMRAYTDVRSMTDWVDAEDFVKRYIGTTKLEASAREPENVEAVTKWLYIVRLYSLAGLHLKEGADPDLLFELYPYGSVMNLWEQFESVFRYQRKIRNDPGMCARAHT